MQMRKMGISMLRFSCVKSMNLFLIFEMISWPCLAQPDMKPWCDLAIQRVQPGLDIGMDVRKNITQCQLTIVEKCIELSKNYLTERFIILDNQMSARHLNQNPCNATCQSVQILEKITLATQEHIAFLAMATREGPETLKRRAYNDCISGSR